MGYIIAVLKIVSMLAIVMVISGFLKESGALGSVYAWLRPKVKSNRALIAILSVLFGVIPVPGRICVTCSLLDGLQDKTRNNQKMGIVAHLSSHHYYLWSPMEKAVIIVCGILGISYGEFMSYMGIPALIMILFSIVYIFTFVGENELALIDVGKLGKEPKGDKGIYWVGALAFVIVASCFAPDYTWFMLGTYALCAATAMRDKVSLSWFSYETLALASVAVVLGTFFTSYQKEAMEVLAPFISGHNIAGIAAISFLVAFLMGSSAKYAAICGAIVTVVGIKYLPLFYLVEFAGYLVSPSHDCVAIAKTYFKTATGMFFQPLITLSVILILYGALVSIL